MNIETMETIFDEYMRHNINSSTAVGLLEKHYYLSSKEAESLVNAWNSKKADQKHQE
jgi:hypothetical protein